MVCPGSLSCSCPSHAATISPSPGILSAAPQLTRGRLASAPFWKQLEAPEKSLRQRCVPLQQADTNPRAAGAASAGQPRLSGGEGWAAAGVRRQVNGSRGCCTIGFHLPAS